jgi:hypothetical protein
MAAAGRAHLCATLGRRSFGSASGASQKLDRRAFSAAAAAATAASQQLDRELAQAAQLKQTGVSLATLLSFGRQASGGEDMAEVLSTSAHFLKRELPIRLAHRALELDTLPHGLSATSGIQTVSDWYKRSFAEIRAFPPLRTMDDIRRFSQLLEAIYARHNPTVVQVAKGAWGRARARGEQRCGSAEVRDLSMKGG